MQKIKKSKRHYYIMLRGEYVGESWAVSPEKAINNYWWRRVKNFDRMTERKYEPSDFDAVEA